MVGKPGRDLQLARLLHDREIDGLLLYICNLIHDEKIVVSDNTLDTLAATCRSVRDGRRTQTGAAGWKS